MELNQIQILDRTIYILLHASVFVVKGMNPCVLPQAIGK